MIPVDFYDMLYKDYLLKVRVTEYNMRGDKFKEFSVDFMTNDDDVLSKYREINNGVIV